MKKPDFVIMTVSIPKEVYLDAEVRRKELGLVNFSALVHFLIEAELLDQKRRAAKKHAKGQKPIQDA